MQTNIRRRKMIRLLIICLAFIRLSEQLCAVEPLELTWPDKNIICDGRNDFPCNLTIAAYDSVHIEDILAQDVQKLKYINDVVRIYQPDLQFGEADLCAVGDTQQQIKCQKICPGSFMKVHTVAHQYEPNKWALCHVIRPDQQIVYYMKCHNRKPILVPGISGSFQCVPEDIIKRTIVVYCPGLAEQCQYMDIELPQHCAASKFTCKTQAPNLKKESESLFASLGLGFP